MRFCPKGKYENAQCDVHGTPKQDRIDYLTKDYPQDIESINAKRIVAGKQRLPPATSAPAPAVKTHPFDETDQKQDAETLYDYKALAQEAIDSMEFSEHQAEFKWNDGTTEWNNAFNQMATLASAANMQTDE